MSRLVLQGPPAPMDPAALERIRGALHAELARSSAARTYRSRVLVCLLATTGLTLVGAAVMGATGSWVSPALLPHLPTLLLLLTLQGLGLYAALAPRTGGLSRGVLAGAAVAMGVLVGGSRFVSPGSSPPWVCTVSHVAFDLLPLAVVAMQLRFAAPDWKRALAAGVAVGTSGAFLGELACGRGMAHVAAYHLPAWLLVTAVVVVLSRVVRPLSYAP